MSQAKSDKECFPDDLPECAKNGVPIRYDEDPSLHYTSVGKRLGKGGTGEVFRWTCKNTGKKVDIMGEGNHPLAYYMTEYANRNLSKTTRTNLEKSHPKFEQEIYDFETIPKYKNLYLQAQKHAETLIQKFLT